MKNSNHTWNFSTVGGVKRVNLDSGADLMHLSELDQKLWTVLSCPVNGLEIDSKTLGLIDKDNDNQIRVPEILEAVNWIISVIKNPDDLLKQDNSLSLSAINDQTEEGKILLSSAKTILKNLGKAHATTISVDETSNIEAIFSASRFNGDGIITEDTAGNSDLIKLIQEIMICVGSSTDRSGKAGISLEQVNSFVENAEKLVAWMAKKDLNIANILPFGDQTENAYLSYCAIRSKVADFFLRSRLSAFDPTSTGLLNLQLARIEAITSNNLTTCLDEIASYPLAKIDSEKLLPLYSGINPAWENKINEFNGLVASNLFVGKEYLTEHEWNRISEVFTAFVNWKEEKEGEPVEPLGLDRIQEILAGGQIEQLKSLIEQDKALEQEANHIIKVDQLVRYHKDLFKLLKNFVTFYDFYSPGSKAIFQAGTLYIDQRSCNLCIKVNDMAKHTSMASFSGMFLLYCECVSRKTDEKMTIVAALTNGDIDNLIVGRNALFYDRNGLDWDTTVVKIIDNPISIRQAFWSPYRKVSQFIETQINKVAAAQDDKVTESATKSIEEFPKKVEPSVQPKPPVQPFDIGKFVGIFAAIGLAFGAIGSIIASFVAGFLGLIWWKMPFALLGIILLISGPSMIMAYLKLRKRNLAPILNANGWAINARAIVNIQFGNVLTHLAELPKGAKINLNDPFTKKKRPFLPVIISLSILAGIILYFLWKYGFIHI